MSQVPVGPDKEQAPSPFAAGLYDGVQTYTTSAEDRLRAVKRFDLAQCNAALQIEGLQRTVERAVIARIRALERGGRDALR